MLETLGLDVDAETPGRKVVRHIGESLVKAMELALSEGPREATELVAAECVVHAETKDHQNWELMGLCSKKLTGEEAGILARACEEVEDEEDEHLYHTMGWCRELWIKALGMPAQLPPPEQPPSEFDELVMEALDDLPEEFREVLYDTPVTVSNRGHEFHAYGQYIGGTIARDVYPDHIVVYRDTLERDFGHDPDLLRAQVERTVRHELAHHLGWDEHGVRGLGL